MPSILLPSLRVRRWGTDGQVLGARASLAELQVASAVDLLCVNAHGSAIEGGSGSGGCDWVDFDWADYLNGKLPRLRKAVANTYALGCVAPDQAASVADGAQVWVRFAGLHPNAKMDGTSAISVGSFVGIVGTDGVCAVQTNEGLAVAQSLDAWSTASTAGKRAWLLNRYGIPLI